MLRFDKTVTLGNILTAAVVAATMLISWMKMETRLQLMESAVGEQRQIVLQQAALLQQLSLTTQRLSTLADIYVPRLEDLSHRQARDAEREP